MDLLLAAAVVAIPVVGGLGAITAELIFGDWIPMIGKEALHASAVATDWGFGLGLVIGIGVAAWTAQHRNMVEFDS